LSEQTFSGGCLCGTVKYEITGTPRSFFHCHCLRCRKATGTGHASNVIVLPSSASWTSGEDKLGEFKVPDAARFRSVFCKECGSPLPRIAPDLSLAVIPAGSLDHVPEISPTDRIFWNSRTSWSCAKGDIPAWDEYPEQR